ncbi:MAG: helix-turn-helix transcriptional regulator [Cyclobacteriaceae bacterium]
MEDFLKMLNSILEKIDIVFDKNVVKNWRHDPPLEKYIKDNYKGFPISWPTVYSMKQKGVFFSRQRPLNSLLAGCVSLPLNQIRISQNAKRERLRLGLTQPKLAEESGLSEKTIRNIENPHRSNYLDTLEKLAKGLQIDISRLLG